MSGRRPHGVLQSGLRNFERATLRTCSTALHSIFESSAVMTTLAVVTLLGELDITSMAQFEAMIGEVLSHEPKGLVFDLTQSEFVSAQGYDAIGRCSLEVPVEVRSRTGVAGRVFAVLGYEQVDVISAQESEVGRRC